MPVCGTSSWPTDDRGRVDAERPRVLSVVWGMRLLGVLLGSVLVNQVFGSAWRLMPAALRCWLVWSVCRW